MTKMKHDNEKLEETLILTTAAMAHRFYKYYQDENHPLVKEISDYVLNQLENCQDEYCKVKYLKTLRNLKLSRSIPVCASHALKGKTKPGVEGMKCLKSFESSFWNDNVLDTAQRIYFQVGKKYDSSSRTLALDILLESNPSREILKDLLLSLAERDREYEVKQYLVQRVKEISERNDEFFKLVNSIKKELADVLGNYNVAAQRGLTTAFSRSFLNDEYRNGSLSTVLEISKGLLKRGIVDVVVENGGKSTSLFSVSVFHPHVRSLLILNSVNNFVCMVSQLGLFAGGLSSFISSDGESEEQEENDVATAGMELSVLNAQIRPFVFFSGQGELMGHVWSGTASEKTPAYQVRASLLLVQN